MDGSRRNTVLKVAVVSVLMIIMNARCIAPTNADQHAVAVPASPAVTALTAAPAVDFHRWFPDGLTLLGNRANRLTGKSASIGKNPASATTTTNTTGTTQDSTHKAGALAGTPRARQQRLNVVFRADRQLSSYPERHTAKSSGTFQGLRVQRTWNDESAGSTRNGDD